MTQPVNPPSGEQFELHLDDQVCVITEVGATIRSYRHGERDVLHPYDVDAMCDGGHGAPLVPWPNRIRDGRYRFDDVERQLALTEPDKHNAIHGLLRSQPWTAHAREAHRVSMRARLFPVSGYPFMLDVSVDYSLGDDGLTVTTSATNVGTSACPFGSGQHPYLSPGDGLVDDCTLQLDAGARIVTDAEQSIPTGSEPVAGTPYDFSSPTLLGDLTVDHGFTDLRRDADGFVRVSLGRPDGATVELWADDSYGVMQLYTADTLAPPRRRRGLAAEPMTCPANAFNTGEGLVRLEPGESTRSTWGVRLR